MTVAPEAAETARTCQCGSRRAYTAEEAAERIQCKASWLKEMARQRKIPFTMPGGSYRWTDAHLTEILAMFEHRPRTGAPARPARKGTRAPAAALPAPDGQAVTVLRARPRRAS